MNTRNANVTSISAVIPPRQRHPVNGYLVHQGRDLEARRRCVLSLRLRRMSEPEIANVLGVSQPTVSRDLLWIRKRWGLTLGAGQLKPEEEIGEAVALFEEVERAALVEYDELSGSSGPARARARMNCLRTAMEARQRRVNLLHDLGFLERRSGGLQIRADELRSALHAEGLLSPVGKRKCERLTFHIAA